MFVTLPGSSPEEMQTAIVTYLRAMAAAYEASLRHQPVSRSLAAKALAEACDRACTIALNMVAADIEACVIIVPADGGGAANDQERTAPVYPTHIYWMSPVPDVCEVRPFRHITEEFVDGKTRGGPWKVMHPLSWVEHSSTPDHSLGAGVGQRYRKQRDGRWLRVEG